MAKLSTRQIYQVALDAGFTPEQAVTWTAIALAESGGRTGALNDRGEHSMGLWQINTNAHNNPWGNLNDPKINARAAFDVSHHGRDMRPWTTTHDSNKGTGRDYRHYLPDVESLIGVQGDSRGVHGYGSPLPAPLERPPADRTERGQSLDPGSGVSTGLDDHQDSDGDGLANAFERLAGTNPQAQDSDGDGVADRYEATVVHTDPLSPDTDRDGRSDPVELSGGTNPGRLPGTAGVLGTGATAYNIRGHEQDSDHDTVPDRVERLLGTKRGDSDSDSDRLTDGQEISLGTNPLRVDTNLDGVTDGAQVENRTDPLAGMASRPTNRGVPSWAPSPAPLASTGNARVATRNESPGSADADGRSDPLGAFLGAAQAQVGDAYVFGHEVKLSDTDPDTFDCSELTQWAANQAGVTIPDGAIYQYRFLERKGMTIPVKDALHTPGALLFWFDSNPDGPGRPARAHVAISKGDGMTIEAKGRSYGVGEWSAKNRFTYAGVIPGISDEEGQAAHAQDLPARSADDVSDPTDAPEATAPAPDPFAIASGQSIPTGDPAEPGALKDSEGDGLTNAFERLAGTDPHAVDTDGDGLSDRYEGTVSHTDPLSKDTDGDRVRDSVELANGTDAGRLAGTAGVVGTSTKSSSGTGGPTDSDRDGLADWKEELLGSDPLSLDSDRDGLADGSEIQHHTSPLAPGSGLGGLAGGAVDGADQLADLGTDWPNLDDTAAPGTW